jgi:N-acetylglutamate synthase-like GNAT family acetyltransferase
VGGDALIDIRVAQEEEIRRLSEKLLAMLADKDSEVYRENVAKFGIPDDYVREAFSEKSLLNAAAAGGAFYVALDDGEILGFGQIVPCSKESVELDRIIIFPESTRRGIGTRLLHEIAREEKTAGIRKIIVRTGKEEAHARSFYEKKGFKETNQIDIDAPWGGKLSLVQYELPL